MTIKEIPFGSFFRWTEDESNAIYIKSDYCGPQFLCVELHSGQIDWVPKDCINCEIVDKPF